MSTCTVTSLKLLCVAIWTHYCTSSVSGSNRIHAFIIKMFSLKHMCSCVCSPCMHKACARSLTFVLKHTYARTCVCPCSCMCVHPRGPWAVQRMSRGCGGSGGDGSVTQRGRWWDRTALQQWGTLQHQTQAGFEYCIRALELSPCTPEGLWSSSPVLNPHSGGRHHRASASVDLITVELMEFGPGSSSVFYKEFPTVECEPQFADVWLSVCVNVMTC